MVKSLANQKKASSKLSTKTSKLLVRVIKPAKMEYLVDLIGPVKYCAQEHGFSRNRINEIELALEEALVNIISYAYPQASEPGNAEVYCWLNHKDIFNIEIKDSGIPFDSLKKEDPDLTGSIYEREIGGLGIFLIKKFMDDVKYRREQGQNILSFTVFKRDEK